jgi:uncharacterized protein YjbJ (UPF0337 family)
VGVLEEAKGKAKEAFGGVSGSNDLRDEGQAQQRKAGEEGQGRTGSARGREAREQSRGPRGRGTKAPRHLGPEAILVRTAPGRI